jgi:Na+/pantothenate symporter
MSATLPLFSPLLAAANSNAALITFLIYTLAVFGLAALSNQLMKNKNFLSEYFLGSRSLGVWAFALTFAATSSSGGSFTGFPSKIYTHGWILGLWIGSYIVVPICAMGLLGKRINHVARISGAITVPDVLRDRFRSASFGLMAVSLIVFFMSFNLIAQFKAGSVILNTLLSDVGPFDAAVGWVANAKSNIGFLQDVDSGYLLCLVTFSFAVILYTTYGGFHAVVWTDVMQGVVMVVGVLIMLPLAINAVGSLPEATQKLARMTPPRLGMLRVSLKVPATENLTLNGPWFTLPGEDVGHPRLFRINKTLVIPKGKTTVDHVRYVEITTPEEIEDQLKRLADQEHTDIIGFRQKLREFIESQIEWIETNQTSLLSADSGPQLAELRKNLLVLEQQPKALLRSFEFHPVDIEFTLSKKYPEPYGDGRPGMYVSGPGPAPPSLPGKPRLIEVKIDQPDAEIRVFDEKNVRQVTRHTGRGRTLISVDSKTYRLDVVKAGFSVFSTNVEFEKVDPVTGKKTEIETVKLDVELIASPDAKHGLKSDGEEESVMSYGFLPLSIAISFFFMWAISGAGQPSSMVRLMAFNNSTTLRRSIFTVAIYYSLIYFPLVIIFCCARVILPGMDLESDGIMPQMAVTLTQQIGQGWLAGLLVAAPFAAVMSTVDSFLLMISSALVRDIYQRNINPEAKEKTIKRLTFLFTFLVGAGATLGAVNPPRFLQDIIVYTGSGLAACFLAPTVFALYWPRSNSQGCMGGMLAGFSAHLAMYIAGYFANGSFFKPYQLFDFNPIIVGLLVSFVSGYIVTRLTPPPPEELVRKYFYRKKTS